MGWGLKDTLEHGEDGTHVSLLAEPSWCITAQTLPGAVCSCHPNPFFCFIKRVLERTEAAGYKGKRLRENKP